MKQPSKSTAAVLRIFDELRTKLLKPENWTQGAPARLVNGSPVHTARKDGEASWCIIGALCRVVDDKDPYAMRVIYLLDQQTDGLHLGGWNDAPGRTHAEVLDLIDRARAAVLVKG